MGEVLTQETYQMLCNRFFSVFYAVVDLHRRCYLRQTAIFFVVSQRLTTDKAASVIMDIESLVQSQDKCSSPKLTKALSRKGSCRSDRRINEEQETEEASKNKLVVKVVSSQMEPFISNKPLVLVTSPSMSSSVADASDARSRRFKTIRPKEILLIFATLSSVGTLILIYFTLAIKRRDGA